MDRLTLVDFGGVHAPICCLHARAGSLRGRENDLHARVRSAHGRIRSARDRIRSACDHVRSARGRVRSKRALKQSIRAPKTSPDAAAGPANPQFKSFYRTTRTPRTPSPPHPLRLSSGTPVLRHSGTLPPIKNLRPNNHQDPLHPFPNLVCLRDACSGCCGRGRAGCRVSGSIRAPCRGL